MNMESRCSFFIYKYRDYGLRRNCLNIKNYKSFIWKLYSMIFNSWICIFSYFLIIKKTSIGITWEQIFFRVEFEILFSKKHLNARFCFVCVCLFLFCVCFCVCFFFLKYLVPIYIYLPLFMKTRICLGKMFI